MVCLGGVVRWAVLAAVTLVVTPGAYAQQNPALPGVTMIDLDGRAVRVQAISRPSSGSCRANGRGRCREVPGGAAHGSVRSPAVFFRPTCAIDSEFSANGSWHLLMAPW